MQMSDKGFHTLFVLGFLLFMILRVYFFRRATAEFHLDKQS